MPGFLSLSSAFQSARMSWPGLWPMIFWDASSTVTPGGALGVFARRPKKKLRFTGASALVARCSSGVPPRFAAAAARWPPSSQLRPLGVRRFASTPGVAGVPGALDPPGAVRSAGSSAVPGRSASASWFFRSSKAPPVCSML